MKSRIKLLKRLKKQNYQSYLTAFGCKPSKTNNFILRSVDISTTPIKINEYLLEFLKWMMQVEKVFLKLLQMRWKIIGLYIDNLRGQGYDNGTNMKGNHQGVQKRLFDVNPRAFYTPCVCHNLNLVLCDMNCTKVVSSFGVIQRIYTLFDFLPSGGKL